jgi:hypothetical protein
MQKKGGTAAASPLVQAPAGSTKPPADSAPPSGETLTAPAATPGGPQDGGKQVRAYAFPRVRAWQTSGMLSSACELVQELRILNLDPRSRSTAKMFSHICGCIGVQRINTVPIFLPFGGLHVGGWGTWGDCGQRLSCLSRLSPQNVTRLCPEPHGPNKLQDGHAEIYKCN